MTTSSSKWWDMASSVYLSHIDPTSVLRPERTDKTTFLSVHVLPLYIPFCTCSSSLPSFCKCSSSLTSSLYMSFLSTFLSVHVLPLYIPLCTCSSSLPSSLHMSFLFTFLSVHFISPPSY